MRHKYSKWKAKGERKKDFTQTREWVPLRFQELLLGLFAHSRTGTNLREADKGSRRGKELPGAAAGRAHCVTSTGVSVHRAELSHVYTQKHPGPRAEGSVWPKDTHPNPHCFKHPVPTNLNCLLSFSSVCSGVWVPWWSWTAPLRTKRNYPCVLAITSKTNWQREAI